MKESNVIELNGPEAVSDGLTELLKSGAQRLIMEAVEEELGGFLEKHKERRLASGKAQIVRNGYLPEREFQTGVGPVTVKVPRTRDRGGDGITFKSSLLPPYLRRSKSIEELLPWLYLKGISTNDFGEALSALFGDGAAGLSASTISRLKASWFDEFQKWNKRDLKGEHYVYVWVDGVHCGVRQDDEKLCILVVLGVKTDGTKELIAIDDGYRESTDSWLQFLRSLKERGMKAPELAVGDGALGFWSALRQVFPETREQRCWQHKTLNVLTQLPKSMKDKALSHLHDIRMAESLEAAEEAFSRFKTVFEDKYPKAVQVLEKDKDSLLTFFNYPAVHWQSLRTTNPIESIFATVRHRASRTKGCVSRDTMMALFFRLSMSAQKRWRKLRGFQRLAEVIEGVQFTNGLNENDHRILETLEQQKVAA